MPRLVMGIVPVLIKIFGGLLAGLLGLNALSQPDLQAIVAAVKASTAVLLVQRPGGVSSGTAFVAADHLAITTLDVVAGASKIILKFPDSEWVQTHVIQQDTTNNLAVLDVPELAIHPLPLGDIANVQTGHKVIIASYPALKVVGSQPEALLDGTVTAVRRGMILFTPSRPLGTYGGPVVNLKGEVIGVVRGDAGDEGAGLIIATAPNAAKTMLGAVHNPSAVASVLPPPPPPAEPTPAPAPAAAVPPQPAPTPSPAAPEPAPTTSEPTAPSQPAPIPPPAVAQPAPATPQPPATPEPVPTPPPPPAAPQPAPTPPPPSPALPPNPAPAATPPPTPSPASSSERFLVLPGLSIGPVQIGMTLKAVEAALGPNKGTAQLSDGTSAYRWFAPPKNDGIGVRVSKGGIVTRVWALNDVRYVTQDGLHVGSAEADIRAKLGMPSNVTTNAQAKTKILTYEGVGIWFSIQEDQQYLFYNAVFEIGIIPQRR